MMNKKKSLSLNEAAAKRTVIAEKSLGRFSEDEKNTRVEAFARRKFAATRTRAK
jgi:hypothetical protein